MFDINFLHLEQHKQSETIHFMWSANLGRQGNGSVYLKTYLFYYIFLLGSRCLYSISRRLFRLVSNSPTWIERYAKNVNKLIDILENNVLESAILSDTVYQRQQGTLIVWSENDVCDLALSFQEKSGCAAIWDKICQIQGRDSNDIDDEGDLDDQQSDSSNSNASSGIASSIALPTCSLTTIQEIDQIILNNMGTPSAREKMANTLHQLK